jgi:hypothetical protein
MDMSTFWSKVSQITLTDVNARFPAAAQTLASYKNVKEAQFAFSVIPNLGPGGATTDEDEADLDERDPDQDITDADGPSLGGDTALMAYFPEIDELFTYREGTGWVLWNY